MKCQITWRRLNPDTVNGYQLEVRSMYYSYDKREIDLLEKDMMRIIPSGISVADLGKVDGEDEKESGK